MQDSPRKDEPGDGPIDAVVTWVDGSDPRHLAKRAQALARRRKFSFTSIPGGRDVTRFADSGELRYCLHAIRRHCPWIRTIHLLTDEQVPDYLDAVARQRLGVRIVDHREAFRGYEWALPTFNSQSIETVLHRIEGLAERFVYFNDDVIVLRETGVEEFFNAGQVVLRGDWRPLPRFGPWRVALSSLANHVADKLLHQVRSMAVLAQYRGAQLAGQRGRYLHAPHTPHPLRRSTIEAFFARHPAALEANIRHPFRDMRQFVTVPLANHLEIAAGHWLHSQAEDHLIVCFNRDPPAAIRAKLRALAEGRHRFLCLQGYERADPDARAAVEALLAPIRRDFA